MWQTSVWAVVVQLPLVLAKTRRKIGLPHSISAEYEQPLLRDASFWAMLYLTHCVDHPGGLAPSSRQRGRQRAPL